MWIYTQTPFPMMNTTSSALKDIIVNLKGGTMVNLTTLAEIKVAKKWGFGKVERLCKMSTQVGCNYERSVNTRLERKGEETTFESGHLPWGKWETFNRIIVHNDKYYARFYLTANHNAEILYLVDGEIATKEQSEIIAKYDNLFNSYSAKQAEHGLTEKQVIPYNPRIEDIVSLSAEGETYKNTEKVLATSVATATR